jgi:hypothetical protein
MSVKSSITGRFVAAAEALINPDTTYTTAPAPPPALHAEELHLIVSWGHAIRDLEPVAFSDVEQRLLERLRIERNEAMGWRDNSDAT